MGKFTSTLLVQVVHREFEITSSWGKSLKLHGNMEKGNSVLVKDERIQPNVWSLAKPVETNP